MKKVLIRYHNKNNLGDDLFIKIITDRYSNEFSIICKDKNETFSKISNLKIYSNPIAYYVQGIFNRYSPWKNLWLLKLSRRNDMLVYIGGSIFMENNNLKRWRREEVFYNSLNIPYYFVSSNFGPYQTADFVDIVSRILTKSKGIVFRDSYSYEMFKSLDQASLAPDAAFHLQGSDSAGATKFSRVAIVSIINTKKRYGIDISKRYQALIIRLVEKLIEEGYEPRLMSFCRREGDEAAINEILEALPVTARSKTTKYLYRGDLTEALAQIQGASLIVGSRFHAVMLGLIYRKKVLPIIYSDKTLNMLEDLGFSGRFIDIHNFHSDDVELVSFQDIKRLDVDHAKTTSGRQFKYLDQVLNIRN